MAMALIIQEFGPEKTRAAWTVISLGAGLAMLVATPLFVMFLFRRTRLREKRADRGATRQMGYTESHVDAWEESGRRMNDHMEPTQDDRGGRDDGGRSEFSGWDDEDPL
jgi:Zn-dependent protease with chaperone function